VKGVAYEAADVAGVGGTTATIDFPGAPANGFANEFRGAEDGFIATLRTSGTPRLVFRTYLGGVGSDEVGDLALVRDDLMDRMEEVAQKKGFSLNIDDAGAVSLTPLVDGKVPLIIELKYHSAYLHTVQTALQQLEGYTGDYCLESFHPAIVKYLRKHAPGILRGQLSSGNLSSEIKPFSAFLLKHLLFNEIARPHFIAYDFYHDTSLSLRLNRLWFKPYLVAWTVKSQPDLDVARTRYDAVIFEGFTPDTDA